MKKLILLTLFLIPVSQVQAQFGRSFFAAESVCLQDNLGYQIQLSHNFISGDLQGSFLRTGDGEVLVPSKTNLDKDASMLPTSGPAFGLVSPGFSYVVTKKRWRSYFQDAYSLNMTLGGGIVIGPIGPIGDPFIEDPLTGAQGGGSSISTGGIGEVVITFPPPIFRPSTATISAQRNDPDDSFRGYLSFAYYGVVGTAKDSGEKTYYQIPWEGGFSEGACTRTPEPSGWPTSDRRRRFKSLETPFEFALDANYPNPFNPSTTIGFSIPEASDVSIKVFDLMGREVMDLMNDFAAPGIYQVQFDASGLSSGTYLYVLQAGDYRETRQMVLMK